MAVYVRFEDCGVVKFGEVKGETVEILSGCIYENTLNPTGETIALSAIKKYLTPVEIPNVLAIGANYIDHCKECDAEAPKNPLVFIKTTNALAAHGDEIVLPRLTPDAVDYEAELAVIIGKAAKNVEPEQALDYVFGYTCANDVSARDCQYENGQWARGKSFDNFCPLGPWIETELDPLDLEITGKRNGKVVQNSRTSLMIFPIPFLISYLSRTMTLLPGTVLLTGTPAGVVLGVKNDPQWLKPGETFEVEIEGLGSLKSVFK